MPTVSFDVVLNASDGQVERLEELQTSFVAVCNAIAPVVRDAKCWNRVALHHLVYKQMRERFPQMGSQMVCNAIYTVCRAARLIYQGQKTPCLDSSGINSNLPLIQFENNCPVCFDRHTLSVSKDMVSMYTLDGRMKFEMMLDEMQLRTFKNEKLMEILLLKNSSRQFLLKFVFELIDAGLSRDTNHANFDKHGTRTGRASSGDKERAPEVNYVNIKVAS